MEENKIPVQNNLMKSCLELRTILAKKKEVPELDKPTIEELLNKDSFNKDTFRLDEIKAAVALLLELQGDKRETAHIIELNLWNLIVLVVLHSIVDNKILTKDGIHEKNGFFKNEINCVLSLGIVSPNVNYQAAQTLMELATKTLNRVAVKLREAKTSLFLSKRSASYDILYHLMIRYKVLGIVDLARMGIHSNYENEQYFSLKCLEEHFKKSPYSMAPTLIKELEAVQIMAKAEKIYHVPLQILLNAKKISLAAAREKKELWLQTQEAKTKSKRGRKPKEKK